MSDWWNADPVGPAKPALDPRARELAIRTVLGEAANQPDQGMAAVAAVINNRVKAGGFGADVPSVVTARNQFEPWNTQAGRDRMYGYKPDSDAYKRAAAAVDSIFGGGEDPTGGATYFYAPGLQASLGRKTPSFAKGEPTVIGDHYFYGGKQPMTDVSAQRRPAGDWWANDPVAQPQDPSVAERSATPLQAPAENAPALQAGLEQRASVLRGEPQSYTENLKKMFSEGVTQAGQGLSQLKTAGGKLVDPASDPGNTGAIDANAGIYNTAAGALGAAFSPLNAAIDQYVGRPVERQTGIPAAATDFVAGLALPTKLPKFAKGSNIPSREALLNEAEKGFEAFRKTGPSVPAAEIGGMADDIANGLRAEGFRDYLAPKAFGLLNELKAFPAGATVEAADLHGIRRVVGKLASSADKDERAAAMAVKSKLDEYIGSLPGTEGFRDAIGNYAAAKRSQTVGTKEGLAEFNAATSGSGANIDNTTRQAFKQLIRPSADGSIPAKKMGFSDAEIAEIEKVVRGGPVGNTARLIGKVAPTGVVSGSLSGGAGFAAGGPLGAIALPITGYAFKKLSDTMTASQVAKLDELVRSNSPLAKSLGAWGEAADGLQGGNVNARTVSKYAIASRNLVNNLKDAGIDMSPADFMKAIQGPASGRAEDNKRD